MNKIELTKDQKEAIVNAACDATREAVYAENHLFDLIRDGATMGAIKSAYQTCVDLNQDATYKWENAAPYDDELDGFDEN